MRASLALILSLTVFAIGAADVCVQAQDTPAFQLLATVYEREDTVPIAGARIEVLGTDGTILSALSDDKGHVAFTVNGRQRFINANVSYSIRISSTDRMTVHDQISTVGLTESTTFERMYYLARAQMIIDVLPVIYFGQRSTRLDSASRAFADEVTMMLNDNPTMVLELRGHCDPDEDTTLAVRRGETVMHYLMKEGIDAQRIIVRSSGARESYFSTTALDSMTQIEREQALALNRRVDFKIVSSDYHK